jgi:hypothetical protein
VKAGVILLNIEPWRRRDLLAYGLEVIGISLAYVAVKHSVNTVKPVLNGHFIIKRNFMLNGNIFKFFGYHSIP